MSDLIFPCPSCRERAVARRSTGATEVDTFDDELGGWTEHHYEDVCARCGWRRSRVTRQDPSAEKQYQTRDDRLFYQGTDTMFAGALFGEVRVRAELPAAWPEGWDAVPREDSARLLGRVLERDAGGPVTVTFETDAGSWERRLEVLALVRGAVSLGHQLAQVDHASAVIGKASDDAIVLEASTHAGARVIRLLVGKDEQWCGNADVVLAAIDAMWRERRAAMMASFAARSAVLAAAFDALTAGLTLPVAPVEPLGVGLEMLARVAPAVHADVVRSRDGADGPEIWRGVTATVDGPPPAQYVAWLAANRDRDDAFYLHVRPGQMTMWSRRDGRLAVVHDVYPSADLAGPGARLTFAWAHRAAFVDGLSLSGGALDATAPVRARGTEPLTLLSINGDHPVLRLEPGASITLGRSPDNDVQLQHRIVSRKQCVLSAHDDRWFIRDSGESTGGTYVNGARFTGETELCLGDELGMGALEMLVS